MQESKDEIARELRAREIMRVGKRGHIDFNIISKAITNDTPINEWKTFVLETLTAQKSTLESPTSKFSMTQLILDKSEGNDISGAEREVISDEFTKERCREAVAGVFLPREVFKSKTTNKRDLTAGVDSAGGYTIDDSLLDLIEPLDPDLPMLSRVRKTYSPKPFSIPRKLTKTQAEWIGETGEAQEQDVEFDEIKQRPYNLVGWTTFSKELLMSSSVEVESLVRSDLRMALAIGAEKALLKATGVNQPLGLENRTPISEPFRGPASTLSPKMNCSRLRRAFLGKQRCHAIPKWEKSSIW